MTKEVILNPSVDSSQPKVILVDPVANLHIPDGFYVDVLKNGDECLVDSFGRINATVMYEQAKKMSPDMPDRSPTKWRRSTGAKKFEALIDSLIKYPSYYTVSGGKRMGDYQTAPEHFDNYQKTPESFDNSQSAKMHFDNEVRTDGGIIIPQHTGSWKKDSSTYTPYKLPRSLNGNIQTYGTYMDKRLLVLWGMWVSAPFGVHVANVFLNTGSELSGSGLVLPSDELEKEVDALNYRSQEWVRAARNVSPRYQSDERVPLPDVPGYADFLRETYNLDINVSKLYGWLRFNGFYNFVYSKAGESLPYTPEPDAKYVPSLFVNILDRTKEGETLVTSRITALGMDVIVEKLLREFPQISS